MALREVFRRERRRLPRLPRAAWLFLWGPLIGIFIFTAILYKGEVIEAPIALCDLDHTPLSRQLAACVEYSPLLRIHPAITSPQEGEGLILEGKVWAVVVIPAGFEAAIKASRSGVMESYIVGSNLSMNGLIKRELQSIVSTFGAKVSMQRLEAMGLSPQTTRQNIEPLTLVLHPLFNPSLDYGIYLAPGFLMILLVIFVLLSTIYNTGIELRRGSGVALYNAAEGSGMQMIIGKVVPIGVISLFWAQLLLFVMCAILKVPIRGSWWLLEVGIVLLILCYQAIGVFLVALTANLRLSLSVGGGYGVMAFSFSGLTFPIMAMWPAMQLASHLFPFTPFAELLMDQTLRGAPTSQGWAQLGEMLPFLLLFFPAGRRMKQIMRDKTYWYRN